MLGKNITICNCCSHVCQYLHYVKYASYLSKFRHIKSTVKYQKRYVYLFSDPEDIALNQNKAFILSSKHLSSTTMYSNIVVRLFIA